MPTDIFTQNGILETSQQLRSYWQRAKDVANEWASLYWLEYAFSNPNNIEPVIPPTAKTLVQDVQDRLSAEFPYITQPPRSDTLPAKKNAEANTKALEVMWNEMPIGSQVNDIGIFALIRDLTFEGLVKGTYCLQYSFDPDAWETEPITPVRPAPDLAEFARENGEDEVTPGSMLRYVGAHTTYERDKARYQEKHDTWEAGTRNRIPLRIQPVLWEHLYPSLDGKYVMKIHRRTVGDILAHWPDAKVGLNADGYMRRETDSVEWIEVWTKTHKTFMADSQIVLAKTAHGYGFLPFLWDGPFKTPNRHSGERDRSHRQYESIYSGLDSILRAEVALETLAQAILENYTWPQKVVKTDNPTDIDVRDGPDAVSVIGQGDDMALLGGQAPPAALVALLNRHRETAMQAKGTQLARSVAGGRESGYSRAIQAQFARLKDRPIELVLENTLAISSQYILMMLEHKVRTKFQVWGPFRDQDVAAEIDPKKIDGYYYVRAKMKAVQPMDEAQRINTGISLLDKGAISLERFATEYAGVRDFQRELKQIIRERVIMSDVIQSALEILAMEGYGLPQEAQQAYDTAVDQAAQMRAQQPLMPGADMATQSQPGAPGAALPGSPLETLQGVRAGRKGTPPQPEGAPPQQPRTARRQRGRRGGRRRSRRGAPGPQAAPVPFRA